MGCECVSLCQLVHKEEAMIKDRSINPCRHIGSSLLTNGSRKVDCLMSIMEELTVDKYCSN